MSGREGYKNDALETLSRFDAYIWDDVLIETSRGDFRGIILPRSEFDDSDHLVMKLASGYNVGIDVHTIRSMKKLGKREAHYKIPEKEFPTSPDKPNIGDDRLPARLPDRSCHPRLLPGGAVRGRPRARRHLQPVD